MHFLIDSGSAVPIYAQIVGQVRAAVASGVLGPGDPLPSVRQLASDLRINPNTVVQAYRELDREGLTVASRGQGTFIAQLPEDRRHEERARVARDLVERFLGEARRLGLNESEVAKAMEGAMNRLADR